MVQHLHQVLALFCWPATSADSEKSTEPASFQTALPACGNAQRHSEPHGSLLGARSQLTARSFGDQTELPLRFCADMLMSCICGGLAGGCVCSPLDTRVLFASGYTGTFRFRTHGYFPPLHVLHMPAREIASLDLPAERSHVRILWRPAIGWNSSSGNAPCRCQIDRAANFGPGHCARAVTRGTVRLAHLNVTAAGSCRSCFCRCRFFPAAFDSRSAACCTNELVTSSRLYYCDSGQALLSHKLIAKATISRSLPARSQTDVAGKPL